MTDLTPLVPRLGPLLGKLGSDHDAEVIGAARALRKLLSRAGLNFNDLARAVIEPGKRVVYVERPPDPSPLWRERVEWCLTRDALLDERDREFLHGLTRWQRDDLSRKQQRWLADIEARIAMRAAA